MSEHTCGQCRGCCPLQSYHQSRSWKKTNVEHCRICPPRDFRDRPMMTLFFLGYCFSEPQVCQGGDTLNPVPPLFTCGKSEGDTAVRAVNARLCETDHTVIVSIDNPYSCRTNRCFTDNAGPSLAGNFAYRYGYYRSSDQAYFPAMFL